MKYSCGDVAQACATVRRCVDKVERRRNFSRTRIRLLSTHSERGFPAEHFSYVHWKPCRRRVERRRDKIRGRILPAELGLYLPRKQFERLAASYPHGGFDRYSIYWFSIGRQAISTEATSAVTGLLWLQSKDCGSASDERIPTLWQISHRRNTCATNPILSHET